LRFCFGRGTIDLEPDQIVQLHRVSHRFRETTRYNERLWKDFCFQSSAAEKSREYKLAAAQNSSYVQAFSSLLSAGAGPPSPISGKHVNNAGTQNESYSTRKAQRLRSWNAARDSETIDWYNEYIQRRGPIALSWLEQAFAKHGDGQAVDDMRGLGFLQERPGSSDSGGFVVSPLEDGSVCLWDVRGLYDRGLMTDKLGKLHARTHPGLLSVTGTSDAGLNDIVESPESATSKAHITSTGVVECVSVDQQSRRAYFAVQSGLNEIDLNTLQVISHTRFPFSISALSELTSSQPLTVATSSSLHLFDARTRDIRSNASTERYGRDHLSIYSPLHHPGASSILHSPKVRTTGNQDGDIFVAGRFSSILRYDRAMWPKLYQAIYSGGNLSSLTMLPGLSLTKTQTLVACGEYRGRGSLEAYDIGGDKDSQTSTMKHRSETVRTLCVNRHSASTSKLLSVIPHGCRLAISDADGKIKWMDRTGLMEERRWDLNVWEKKRDTSEAFPAGGDVIRKLVGLGSDACYKAGSSDSGPLANRHDILVWTGDRIGLVSFLPRPRFDANTDDNNDSKDPQETAYIEAMAQALRQEVAEISLIR
jgi:hypothetical protein